MTTGEKITLTAAELSEGLQYSATPGLPTFVAQLKKMQLGDHNPQYDHSEVDVAVTTGSQDALAKAFEMLVNPGDYILVEVRSISVMLFVVVVVVLF